MFFDNHAYGNVWENRDAQDNGHNYFSMVALEIDDETRKVSTAYEWGKKPGNSLHSAFASNATKP